MKILLVTEKCDPPQNKRDGGARIVNTIRNSFADCLDIMQFGPDTEGSASWRFDYPFNIANRFDNRLANAKFIIEKIKTVEEQFTHIIFIHISMQFGLIDLPLDKKISIWTFPMFLTPSYLASGEIISARYFETEQAALKFSKNIITPSHLEKRQLIDLYSVPSEQIYVIPRGIDNGFIIPKVRHFDSSLRICSVGSIKRQKDTISLVQLFARIHKIYPSAKLKIIGAVQNTAYFYKLLVKIQDLNLDDAIEISGYLPPSKFYSMIEDCHIHVSMSKCETFGRSIFETLATGLPNVACKTNNAAAEFLADLPYVKFVDKKNDALNAVKVILSNLAQLSAMSLEIGLLYDDEFLSKLLTAKIFNKQSIGISDFDGTLFHKGDIEKTKRCIKEFKKFPTKVICSARSIDSLINELKLYNLEVDWLIGFSGAVITKGNGELIKLAPLNQTDITEIEALVPSAQRVQFGNHTLQIAVPVKLVPKIPKFRIEIYQNTAFIFDWQASKLRSIHWLLREINWSGEVRVFGDGIYDLEVLNYFDGTRMLPIHKIIKIK